MSDPMLELIIKDLKQDIRSINEKVDKLLQFKWQIVGGATVASLVITSIVQIIVFILKKY